MHSVGLVRFARPWRGGDKYGWDWPCGRYVLDMELSDSDEHQLRMAFFRREDLGERRPFVPGPGLVTWNQVDWQSGRFILNPTDYD